MGSGEQEEARVLRGAGQKPGRGEVSVETSQTLRLIRVLHLTVSSTGPETGRARSPRASPTTDRSRRTRRAATRLLHKVGSAPGLASWRRADRPLEIESVGDTVCIDCWFIVSSCSGAPCGLLPRQPQGTPKTVERRHRSPTSGSVPSPEALVSWGLTGMSRLRLTSCVIGLSTIVRVDVSCHSAISAPSRS